MRALILIMIIFAIRPVFADSIESSTSAGSGIVTEDILYHGQSKALRDEGNGAEWSLDAGYSRVKSQVGRTNTIDITRSLTGTLGEEYNAWRFGGSYLASDTAAENLTERGPSVYLGHTWSSASALPSLDVKARYGAWRYEVDNPAANLSLDQDEAHLGATLSWAKFSLYGAYGKYFYHQNVTRFANAINSRRVIRADLAGIRAAIYGFPTQTYEAAATLSPSSAWQWTLDETVSDTREPKGTVHATSLMVAHVKDPFEVDVGAEHDQDVQFNQNLLLLNLVYRFNE